MEPTNAAEVLRQPVFGNPLITNQDSKPLGLSGRSEGNALVNTGHSRVGNFGTQRRILGKISRLSE
jgi:hypothetical protein